jgi:hypothetical protein
MMIFHGTLWQVYRGDFWQEDIQAPCSCTYCIAYVRTMQYTGHINVQKVTLYHFEPIFINSIKKTFAKNVVYFKDPFDLKKLKNAV